MADTNRHPGAVEPVSGARRVQLQTLGALSDIRGLA
jgi:hypothetical protein